MKKLQGFAAMKPEEALRVRRLGGQNSPMRFKKNDERTRAAGRKGGIKSRKPKAVA